MLVTMKEMLRDAQKNRYAIPAFDVSNYEMMKAALDACEAERSPALLMGLGVDLRGKAMRLMASMVSSASDVYDIPVCFHLDHADSFEMISGTAGLLGCADGALLMQKKKQEDEARKSSMFFT